MTPAAAARGRDAAAPLRLGAREGEERERRRAGTAVGMKDFRSYSGGDPAQPQRRADAMRAEQDEFDAEEDDEDEEGDAG